MASQRCEGPIRRREFLSTGALGLALPDILQARGAVGNQTTETSVIFVWLCGGASQLETYDLKPDAPTEFRSVFEPRPSFPAWTFASCSRCRPLWQIDFRW